MKEWIDITKEYPPLPDKEGVEDSSPLIRVKINPIVGVSDSYREYHSEHYPDGIYEGRIVWKHSVGYVLSCDALDYPLGSVGSYFYLMLSSISHWERETYISILNRWELLDIR